MLLMYVRYDFLQHAPEIFLINYTSLLVYTRMFEVLWNYVDHQDCVLWEELDGLICSDMGILEKDTAKLPATRIKVLTLYWLTTGYAKPYCNPFDMYISPIYFMAKVAFLCLKRVTLKKIVKNFWTNS